MKPLDELIKDFGGPHKFAEYILACAERGERIRRSMTPEQWEAHIAMLMGREPEKEEPRREPPARRIVL